ncbi:MAG TPA: TIGR03435 family protein [Bryobacteraceae bacterium]|jgi:uncharacterized protein (TIGR03435 family)
MLKALWILLALPALAQPPAFEAAAIKPSKDVSGGTSWNTEHGRINLSATLKGMISIAYQVKGFQVAGGPRWIDGDRFEINAKAEGSADDPQLLAMLQTLLADRFQLVIHHEQKIAPAYALVVAKSGLKMKPSEATGSSSKSGSGVITAKGVTMAKLAELLSRRVGAPVADLTETPGTFDFKLEWSIDGDPNDDQSALFAALQSELGVKLESRKLPVDLLVVDRAEKPSDN